MQTRSTHPALDQRVLAINVLTISMLAINALAISVLVIIILPFSLLASTQAACTDDLRDSVTSQDEHALLCTAAGAPADWFAAGTLNYARLAGHTATLLPDGTVLVVGGQGSNGAYLDSAEIYNPCNGSWTPTGSLAGGARGYHAAVMLPSLTLAPPTKVLVTGRVDSGVRGDWLPDEIYDLTTGVWHETTDYPPELRPNAAAVVLASGNVLVAGGGFAEATNGSHQYQTATADWTFGSGMYWIRTGHVMELLGSNQVLVAGGWGGNPTETAELFDPAIYDP